jgi:riboflavin kinase/FMN adenylyltransferase
MKILSQNDRLPSGLSAIVTVGNFDGVHRGHGRLIARTVEVARGRGAVSVVVTFEPHTRSVVHPELPAVWMTTFAEKAALVEKMGVDYVFCVNFDEEFRRMEQEEIIEKVLAGRLNAAGWVMGEGHLVGKNRGGGKKNLHFVGGKYHINILTEPLETVGGAVISSTRIRGLIGEGKIAEAAELLGHPYLIAAERVAGVKIATTRLGFPTLNFKQPDVKKVIPPAGVYVAEIEIRGGEFDINAKKMLSGALYFGDCPTYSGRETHFEFHALEFDKECKEPAIGETVHLWLHKFIRPNIAFESEGALRGQIAQDINLIKKYFSEEMQ